MEVTLSSGNAHLGMDANGILHLRWPAGSHVSEADALSVVAAVERLTGRGPLPMLVEVVDVDLTPGARGVFLRGRFVSAIALVGATIVDRVVAASLMRDQDCPHGYFDSAENARRWIRQFVLPAVGRKRSPDHVAEPDGYPESLPDGS